MIEEYFLYYNDAVEKYGQKTVVLYQCGDFYEIYATNEKGPDISTISYIMDCQLTQKNKKEGHEVSDSYPLMAGFKITFLVEKLERLISESYTVVIVDQITPAPNPKRGIVNIFSPCTYINNNLIKNNTNFIVSIYINELKQLDGSFLECVGLSSIDLSTGKCYTHEAYSTSSDKRFAVDEAIRFINCYRPTEILIYSSKPNFKNRKEEIDRNFGCSTELLYYTWKKQEKYHDTNYQIEFLNRIYENTGLLNSVEYVGLEYKEHALISFIHLLTYAYEHDKNIVEKIFPPVSFHEKMHLVLGNNAINQLNVMNDSKIRNSSLYNIINHTSTSMGKRFLQEAITTPLIDIDAIQLRYDCIEDLLEKDLFVDVETYLQGIPDIDKYHRKLSLYKLDPKDIYCLYQNIKEIMELIKLLQTSNKVKRDVSALNKIIPSLETIKDINIFLQELESIFDIERLQNFFINNIDENIFKKGQNYDLDILQNKIDDRFKYLESFCVELSRYIVDIGKAKFMNKGKLKMKIHKTDKNNYYLRTTKIRGQTLKKNIKDQMINQFELKEIPETDDPIIKLNDVKFITAGGYVKVKHSITEQKIEEIQEIKKEISKLIIVKYKEQLNYLYHKYTATIGKISYFVGFIDFIKSGAKIAKLYNYIKPVVVENIKNSFLECNGLRHPIIERIHQQVEYIPHDITLGQLPEQTEENALNGMLLYGINSSGKSSLMKAIGLSVIMAQAGFYVPANYYRYSPYYSLFTRITGNDDIMRGLSSFTLEMTELSSILKRTGNRTIVIGDEVCHGTETISGNAIVASTLIELHKTKSSFVFATHLHEIADMDRIKNLCNMKLFHLSVQYDKEKDILIFDRKLKEGSGDKIYGILVAKYIIRNNDFIQLCENIKEELLNIPQKLVGSKRSKYNNAVFITECEICKKSYETDPNGFDTHHINQQKDCINNYVVYKPHMHRNSKANLVVLCKQCHIDVHNYKININGYLDTSNGRILDYNYNECKTKSIKKKKYNDDQIKLIKSLSGLSQKSAKIKLKNEHQLNVSIKTIKCIWDNEYK